MDFSFTDRHGADGAFQYMYLVLPSCPATASKYGSIPYRVVGLVGVGITVLVDIVAEPSFGWLIQFQNIVALVAIIYFAHGFAAVFSTPLNVIPQQSPNQPREPPTPIMWRLRILRNITFPLAMQSLVLYARYVSPMMPTYVSPQMGVASVPFVFATLDFFGNNGDHQRKHVFAVPAITALYCLILAFVDLSTGKSTYAVAPWSSNPSRAAGASCVAVLISLAISVGTVGLRGAKEALMCSSDGGPKYMISTTGV
jgi:hypothetical protein